MTSLKRVEGEQDMEWWQPVSMVGSVAVMMTALATLGWRVLERMRIENQIAHDKIGESIVKLREDLSGDIAKVRSDLSSDIGKVRSDLSSDIGKVHRDLSGNIEKVRSDLCGDIAGLRKDMDSHVSRLSGDTAGLRSDMDANFAKVRDDIGEVREGLAELRGEFKGMNRSLQDFREDFRVHVYGGTASA